MQFKRLILEILKFILGAQQTWHKQPQACRIQPPKKKLKEEASVAPHSTSFVNGAPKPSNRGLLTSSIAISESALDKNACS
jgi:hypothetical protein